MPEERFAGDDDAFAALVLRHLDGATTPAEDAMLNAELADPANAGRRETFVSLSRQRGQLAEALAPRRLERKARRFRSERRSPVRIRIAAAAALALVAVAVPFALRGGKTPPIAVIEAATGEVTRVAGSERFPAAMGEGVWAGEGLETGGRGTAVLRFGDGTRLELSGGTKVRGIDTKGGKRLLMTQGVISADAARQPAGEPMVLRTAEGEAKVLGTRLKLSAAAGRTRLEVEAGRVRLTRLSDRKSAEVSAGQYAEAAPGVEPVARPIAAAKIADMAPDSWLALPGTAMAKVFPDKAKFPAIQGRMGPDGVIAAWSGGAFDTRRNRLVVWGGGYTDYHGNELYGFSLDAVAWERITEPSAVPNLNSDTNADGRPNSRATYNGLAYIAQADRLFALGGAIAGNGFAVCNRPWIFDFETKTWAKRSPSGPHPPTALGNVCSYDPLERKVWWGDGKGLYSYDVERDSWTKHNDDEFYYLTGAIDTKRRLWVLAGKRAVYAYDLRSPGSARQVWKTTGGDAVLTDNPGLDYDPVRDRITLWSGGAVHTLDPETKAWTAREATGAPARTANGVFGRWRYVPQADAFILVTAASADVHVYKPGK